MGGDRSEDVDVRISGGVEPGHLPWVPGLLLRVLRGRHLHRGLRQRPEQRSPVSV